MDGKRMGPQDRKESRWAVLARGRRSGGLHGAGTRGLRGRAAGGRAGLGGASGAARRDRRRRGCSPRALVAGARPRHPCWASQPRHSAPPRAGSPFRSLPPPPGRPRLGRKTPRDCARVGAGGPRGPVPPQLRGPSRGPSGSLRGPPPAPSLVPQVCGVTRGASPFVSPRALPAPPHPTRGRGRTPREPFLLRSLAVFLGARGGHA